MKKHDERQKELFTFVPDPNCVGLPFQSTVTDPRMKWFLEQDRRDDVRGSAHRQLTFTAKLTERPLIQERITRRKSGRGRGLWPRPRIPAFNPFMYRDRATNLPINGDWH